MLAFQATRALEALLGREIIKKSDHYHIQDILLK
jgi:hypothetical protein